jgi:hypothetical protein
VQGGLDIRILYFAFRDSGQSPRWHFGELPMHSAIVAIELPPDTYNSRQAWQAFAAAAERAVSNPAVKTLGPNVWLVNFQQSPAALAELIVACERFGHTYEILQLDAEPMWLRREADNRLAKTG